MALKGRLRLSIAVSALALLLTVPLSTVASIHDGQKVVLYSIDGAQPHLVKMCIEMGICPNFKLMVEKGIVSQGMMA